MRNHSTGASLVETLIALLVAGVALAALAGLSTTLSRNAESARQRSEATQLAREKIEAWRSIEQLEPSAGGPALAYADLADGSDNPIFASPTSYSRRWTVTPGPDDRHRLLRVGVTWADRSASGTAGSVTLATLIGRSAPTDAGSLALPPPGNEPWQRPRDRSIQVPYEASQLRGINRGKSSLPWDASTALVFDDNTGQVIARCGTVVGDATDLAASCTSMLGYLLEGYIGGALPADPAAISIVFDRLTYLAPGTSPQCIVGPATAMSGGTSIPQLSRYRCLLQPSDHDGNPATPRVWSGRTSISGIPGGSLVCRYSQPSSFANVDHPEFYSLVQSSLGQQNFLISANGSCPSGTVLQAAT